MMMMMIAAVKSNVNLTLSMLQAGYYIASDSAILLYYLISIVTQISATTLFLCEQ